MDLSFLNSPDVITILLIVNLVWTLPWKGVALWKSAKNKQIYWFIALLVVNSFAILEIIYIFFFQKKSKKDKRKPGK